MTALALITIPTAIILAVIIDRMPARCHPSACTARQNLPLPAWPKLWQASAGALQGLAACCLAASCILALPPLASADPVPASRRLDWSYAGVPGGIPNRTTICATFSPGATASAINNAINSCNNGVVYLNAGTYSFSGAINVRSNVTLRGGGADKTIINGAGYLQMYGGTSVQMSGTNNRNGGTAIMGGATKGSTTFTVASTANLSVGRMIEISRTDDPSLIPFFNSWSSSDGRSIAQTDVITAMSGNTVTVRNPLIFDFASASPQVTAYYPATVSMAGIEDLKIDLQGQGGAGIQISACDSCWVKGTDVGNGGNYVIRIDSSVNLELRDNFFHDGGTGPNHGGIVFLSDYRNWDGGGGSSNAKVENNIINKFYPNIEINNDSSGLYIGYNYAPGSNGNGNAAVKWTFDDDHAPFPLMNLYEGNIADQWGSDGYYGGSGYGTALRNYFSGYNTTMNGGGDAVWLMRLAYNYSIVGNVLGSTQQNPVGYLGCGDWSTQFHIYNLGYPNMDNCGTTPATPDSYYPPGGYPDTKVTSTLLRWGNYDYFIKATRFVASEIPSGVPVPSDQVIPKSYYYTATPSWWPSTIPWPPIGPDVTGGNGDTSGHVNKIPAQVCWETSNLKGGGAFKASACYAATASAKPAITSLLTASGTAGTPFSYTITATNNPTSFNATGLPTGLSVNTSTGAISGTPSAAGTYSVPLSATNAAGTGTATLTLTISASSVPVITSPLTASGTVGSPFSYTITATNSPTSFNAAVLPPGLSVNSSTGIISGTPTAVGNSSVTLSATNTSGTGTAKLALTISASSAPVITSPLTASGTTGSPFSYQIAATNNPTSFNAAGLPPGLSVNTATGVISGAPTAAGTSSVTLSATNAGGTGSATLALTISPVSSVSESLFSGTSSPPMVVQNDPNPVELGVKFYATRAGSITGVRFYKNTSDTGTHTAHFWTSTGQLLASATFTNETASGWQQVNFSMPVAISANTTYIASYHSNGNYGETDYFFNNAYTSGSLIAPSSASSGGNSVYAYGGGGSFPSNSWQACNYWVDVVFK
jgi:Domain of unknown function (DUF4082)/Putative Ig domain/Pectate lyase superfamily protein